MHGCIIGIGARWRIRESCAEMTARHVTAQLKRKKTNLHREALAVLLALMSAWHGMA